MATISDAAVAALAPLTRLTLLDLAGSLDMSDQGAVSALHCPAPVGRQRACWFLWPERVLSLKPSTEAAGNDTCPVEFWTHCGKGTRTSLQCCPVQALTDGCCQAWRRS